MESGKVVIGMAEDGLRNDVREVDKLVAEREAESDKGRK